MEEREKSVRQTQERAIALRGRKRGGVTRTGLAVEGPGFLVWDEIASDARRRAGELSAVASWRNGWAGPRG